jgi:DNA-binding transcriptional ArsR family regulator
MPQRIPARIELKPAQRTALEALSKNGSGELTRGIYQELTGMSRSQAAYDLADLVDAGILERVGRGRTTRYRLASEPDPKQRQWTNDRIRAELERFCAGREMWPSAVEFKRSGRTDLYVAASRYGGIRFWAAELGLPRGDSTVRPVFRRPRRLSWAASGAAAGALLVGVAVAIVNGSPDRQPASSPRAAAANEPTAPAARSQAVRPASSPRGKARPRPSKTDHRQAVRPARADSATAKTISHAVHVSPPPSEPVARIVHASTPPPSGPTPLAAPASAGAPAPIPAP